MQQQPFLGEGEVRMVLGAPADHHRKGRPHAFRQGILMPLRRPAAAGRNSASTSPLGTHRPLGPWQRSAHLRGELLGAARWTPVVGESSSSPWRGGGGRAPCRWGWRRSGEASSWRRARVEAEVDVRGSAACGEAALTRSEGGEKRRRRTDTMAIVCNKDFGGRAKR